MKTHTSTILIFLIGLFGSWAGCGGASMAARDKVESAPHAVEKEDPLIETVDAQALEPASLEAAAVTKSRGDAVYVDGKLVLRGASGGLVIGEMSEKGDRILERATVYLADAVSDVLVYKDVAFAACGPQGVVLVDISDLSNPKPLKTLKTFGAALRFSLLGERLAVANGSMGVLLLDVSDPRNPVPKSVWRSDGYVRQAVLTDDGLFAAEDLYGVAFVRIDEKDQMSLVWRRDTKGQARALRYKKGTLFVANGPAGLLIFDFSNPKEPVEKGRLALKDMARDVTPSASGARAFVANGDDGIIIIDVSDPAAMKETGVFVPDKPANRIRGDDDRLYVGNDSDGLLVLDVSDPDKPARVFPPVE